MVSRPDVNRADIFQKQAAPQRRSPCCCCARGSQGRRQAGGNGHDTRQKIAHEEFEPLALTLHSQNVDVKRVTLGRPVDEKFGERREGGTLTIPVFEYVPVLPCS